MLVDQLQRLDNPSAQEQAVADYILAHPAEIEGHTVQSLAKVSFTSASTVMRVCKKLGCSGFRDFRVRFASELTTSSAGIFVSLDRPLLNRDSDEKGLADLLPRFYSRILYETNHTLDRESLLRAVQLLDAARVVDVYGTGQSEALGRRFVFSLETQGKVGALHTAPNIHMIEGLSSDMSRVSVLLSHTGDNEMVVNVAKLLRQKKVPCIAVAPTGRGRLREFADYTLGIYQIPRVDQLSLFSYPISMAYVLDLLAVSLFPKSLDALMTTDSESFYEDRGLSVL